MWADTIMRWTRYKSFLKLIPGTSSRFGTSGLRPANSQRRPESWLPCSQSSFPTLRSHAADPMKRPFVNITIPVYNEERILAESIGKVVAFLASNFRYAHEIAIVDNASIDRTLQIARELQASHDRVHVLHLDEKGRGRAVKTAWNESKADILSYMDCDLSTDLAAFPPLIELMISGRFDVAVGSRLLKLFLTTRGFRRETISRGYNLLIKACFRTKFSDAQCGFKAITKRAAQELLPLIEDNGWFMDTELLILTEKLGYRIFDLPVRWMDDPDTRVRIWSTAIKDIRGLLRLRRNFVRRTHCRSACKELSGIV